jgi:hypothetical protein
MPKRRSSFEFEKFISQTSPPNEKLALMNLFFLSQSHASVLKGAATPPVPCPRIPCTARDRFCDPVGQVALPWEIQCHRKRGIRLLTEGL